MKLRQLITLITLSLFAISCNNNGKFTSMDIEAFGRAISKPDVQLVDVRTPAEYDHGHIPGAINIDVSAADFAQKILTLDPKHTVAVYCRSGRRSKSAAETLAKAGFKVVELNSGIISWRGSLEN